MDSYLFLKRLLAVVTLLISSIAVTSNAQAWGHGHGHGHGHIRDRHVEKINLDSVERLGEGILHGPEGMVFDSQGLLYTGIADGTIRTVNTTSGEVSLYAYTVPDLDQETRDLCGTSVLYETICGRPLGLRFDSRDNLYVADAYKGLLKIPRNDPSNVQTLVDKDPEDNPLLMPNSVLLSDDEKSIYFTDSSQEYQRYQFIRIVANSTPDGRLFEYNLENGELTTLVDDLEFANGIQFDSRGTSIVVVESASRRIRRYWLRGPLRGRTTVFADELLGYPDNIHRHGDLYYVGVFSTTTESIEELQNLDDLRSLVYEYIPDARLVGLIPTSGQVLVFNERGRLVRRYIDEDASEIMAISEAYPVGNQMYLCSVINSYLGRFQLPEEH